MQRAEAHVYFADTIGMGDWFYGTTLNDVRYCVEGDAIFRADSADNALPAKVVLHFPKCQGGNVLEGYGIYNYLRGLAAKGIAIESRVEGLCASIAVLVALAADKVEMADAALWMVHKPSSCGLAMPMSCGQKPRCSTRFRRRWLAATWPAPGASSPAKRPTS